MEPASSALSALRPIHIPDPQAIGWWPLAPGWWLLLVAFVLLFVIALLWFKKRNRNQRQAKIRAILLQEVDQCWLEFQQTADTNRLLAGLIGVGKKTRLMQKPEAHHSTLALEPFAFFQQLASEEPAFNIRSLDLKNLLADAYRSKAVSTRNELEIFRNAIIEWITNIEIRLEHKAGLNKEQKGSANV